MGRSYRIVGLNSKRNSFKHQELDRIEDEELDEMLVEAQNTDIEEYEYDERS